MRKTIPPTMIPIPTMKKFHNPKNPHTIKIIPIIGCRNKAAPVLISSQTITNIATKTAINKGALLAVFVAINVNIRLLLI